MSTALTGDVDHGTVPGVSERVGTTSAAPSEVVGWRFVLGYVAAYTSTSLLFLAPLLVSLALKIEDLVGLERAPSALALVAGVGAALAVVANPVFGALSDRTTSRFGRRRPWMLGGLLTGTAGVLVVAAAPGVPTVLAGWCIAQLGFNALLASMAAVLPDQVPLDQRGTVAGGLGTCVPVASIVATFLVDLTSGSTLAMFALPCLVGGAVIVVFLTILTDPTSPLPRAPRRPMSLLRSLWVDPRTNRDFAWTFLSRFLFVLAFAFLTTYQAYYILDHLGSAEADVPRQILLATLMQGSLLIVASLLGGRWSDRTGRRKVFVTSAAVIYAMALFLVAAAGDLTGFLIGMAVGGVGFGLYMAVDLALVVDVLPDPEHAAKDLGVLNIAGALPSSIAPAVAPAVLAVTGGSYPALYVVAGVSALLAGLAILPVRGVR